MYKQAVNLVQSSNQYSKLSKSKTMVYLPVWGHNPQALASGLSPIQADKPWYNYFILPSSVKTLRPWFVHLYRKIIHKLFRTSEQTMV